MIRLLVTSLASVLLLCAANVATAEGFEVWLVDQSNSPGVAYGGAIYIYEGDDLMGEDAAQAPAAKIDLGLGTAQLCMAARPLATQRRPTCLDRHFARPCSGAGHARRLDRIREGHSADLECRC